MEANRTKLMMIAIVAVAYLVWPMDLIPDFIPGIGYIDDIVGLLLAGKGIIGG